MRQLSLPAWLLFLIGVHLGSPVVSSLRAGDWTHWRGPTFNGVAPDRNLPDAFKTDKAGADNLVWKAPHGCRSTPIVMNGRVYFNSHTGLGNKEQESVICLDADSGKLLWQHKFNVFFTDIVSNRVGWTNLAGDPATGNVYCHGTSGLLFCFDRDGKVLWERSLAEEFGRVSGYGGRLTSPIVDGDLLIIGMNCAAWGEYGRGGCRFIAFDKKNGDLVWWGSTRFRVLDSFQSSPVVATIGGERLLISGGGDGGLHAFKVRTGEKVWTYLFCHGAVNTTPVVDGNLVYCAHGDINPEHAGEQDPQQGRVLCVDGSEVKDGKPKLVWKVDGLKIKFASPVLHDGRLILNDEDGKLHCLDAKTGTSLWELKVGGGGNVRCSPVLADGKFYVGDSRGRFYILKDEGKKKPKRPKALVLTSHDPKTGDPVDAELDGAVAIANGRLYFGTGTETFCVGGEGPRGKGGAEDRKAEQTTGEGKPAHLQVVPADVTLPPGGSASFKARLFDEKGNFLREVKAEWDVGPMLPVEEVPGLPPPPKINPPPLKGKVASDGKLTLDSGIQGQFGNVVAKAEGLTGRARVRQVPKLPYKQDFEKVPVGAVPGGFVNAQVKFQVREEDGSKVLVKTATNANAIVARANAFIGPADWTDYTIEADVRGKQVDGALPDMGVVANRYQFFLFGEGQQLCLITWEGLLRIDKSISFPWKGNVWYRMKLSVKVDGDKATVRGKIWPRGEKEPAKWTLEAEDPIGNKSGSAALFAEVPPRTIKPNRPGAEVFFDNLVIAPNKGDEPSGKAPESRDGAKEDDLRNKPRLSTPAALNHDGSPRRSAEESTSGAWKLWLAGGGGAAVLLLIVVCLWRR
ncbi:MAG TPA: PQQ-binding-like beta-propeller repeat protein [Gemmataceae bacterium]|nr:PQQ-binding-like beta-propeller repeat protein [Gemmataceae bacterium]